VFSFGVAGTIWTDAVPIVAAQLGGAPDDYVRLELALRALVHGTAMLLIAKTVHPEDVGEMREACRKSIETLLREARLSLSPSVLVESPIMADIGDTFKPGARVPQSGIYDVFHDPNHSQRHQVTCVYGETFPPCNRCGHQVHFKLAMKAIHLTNHDYFK